MSSYDDLRRMWREARRRRKLKRQKKSRRIEHKSHARKE